MDPKSFAEQVVEVHSKVPTLRCNYEEADQRIQFHVNYEVNNSLVSDVLVSSGDADVFVNLMYYFFNTWNTQGLHEIWFIKGNCTVFVCNPCFDWLRHYQ